MSANQQHSFGINAPVNSIYSFLKIIAVLNILFLVGTWLSANQVLFPNIITLQWYLSEFNFAKENVVASWYSSMLFLSTGVAALLCFWSDMQRTSAGKNRLLNYGWLVMAGIFMVLSFDEMGSFHEMLSQTNLFKKAGGGNGKIIFFGLIGAVALFMFVFFISKFKTDKLALALSLAGVILFISNPFQEKFEIQSWRSSPNPAAWRRPIGYLLLEEGSEIFASYCFLFSFVAYAIKAAPGINEMGERILKLQTNLNKYLVFWVGALTMLLGVLMFVIHNNAWNIPGDDVGLPEDWPPAFIFFVSFLAAVYVKFKKGMEAHKSLYTIIASAALIASAYFGSYMYGYWQGPFGFMRFLFLGINIGTALVIITKIKDTYTRLLVTVWIAFMALSFTKREFNAALYGYIGGACLLLALIWHYTSVSKKVH